MVSKAREFDLRKRNIIKRVSKTLNEDPIAKMVRREFNLKSDGRLSSKSRSKSVSKSRSNSRERHYPLRNLKGMNVKNYDIPAGMKNAHSPP